MRRSSSLAEAWGSFGREYLLYNLLRASPRVITGKGVSEPRQSARRRCPVQGNPWLTDQRTRVTRRICGARPSLGWIVMDNDTSLEWIVMPHRQLQSPCVLSLVLTGLCCIVLLFFLKSLSPSFSVSLPLPPSSRWLMW